MRQYHVEALLALRKLSSKPLFERVLEQMHVQPSLPDSGGVRVNLPCLCKCEVLIPPPAG